MNKRTLPVARYFVYGGLVAAACASLPAWCAPQSGDARVLGAEEARLSYCTKADPKDAPGIQEHIRRLTLGTPSEAIEAARKKPEYQKGYDAEMQFVEIVDPRNVKRVCDSQTDDKK